MIPIQPTGIHYYLSRARNIVPPELRHYFYASWEDALWDVLKYFCIPKNSVALIPSFFCNDVVINMRMRGLRCIWYPVNQSLQTNPVLFRKYLKKYKPGIVVIFHAAGITNQLLEKIKVWKPELPSDSLLIEDCVHRLVDPQTIRLVSPRHVIIDSLRKVSPLPGSNLYGDARILHFTPTPAWKTLSYQVQVFGWWFLFQLSLTLVRFHTHKSWRLFWNSAAEKTMKRGYEIIGDSSESGSAWPGMRYAASYLSFSSISRIKTIQVKRYREKLHSFLKTPLFILIPFYDNDSRNLRGFPVGLKKENAQEFLTSLRQKGLLLRFELDDSPWSKHRKIIYLPLGPHLSLQEIDWIASVFIQSVKTVFFDT